MPVLVREDETVASWNCRERVDCNTIALEIGLESPVRIQCPNYQGRLPNKLGELLSSMYLIGVSLSLRKPDSICHKTKIYGWLILRNQFNFGIELDVSTDKPESQDTVYFIKLQHNQSTILLSVSIYIDLRVCFVGSQYRFLLLLVSSLIEWYIYSIRIILVFMIDLEYRFGHACTHHIFLSVISLPVFSRVLKACQLNKPDAGIGL
jgi:hypothetical protein